MAESEGQASTIRVEVDVELKARWEVKRDKIAEAQKGGAECFLTLWKAVTDVIESSPPLYLAAGFSSASGFIEKYLKLPTRTATRYIEVARIATRAELERHGTTKLDAALGLLNKDSPSFDKVRVKVERHGKPVKLGLGEVTGEEIRLAVRALRPKSIAPKSRNATAVLLTNALTAGKIKGVTVVVSKAGINFRGLEVANLRSLIKALERVKLPNVEPVLRPAA